MTSIVIAAHNEAAVISRTLDALLTPPAPLGQEIIVVANGCTDDTVAIARGRGVQVIDRAEPGKAAALNAGDAIATTFPRIYLDADIVLPPGGVEALVGALEATGALAAVPARRVALTGRPWPVRAYFTISQRLPVFRDGLFGRGCVALSRAGRGRFGTFPLMVADDLFLDSLFSAGERTVVPGIEVVVEAPYSTVALFRRLVRVRRGNAAMRAEMGRGGVPRTVRPSDRWSWLRDVVLPNPRLLPAGVVYFVLTLAAAIAARRGPSASLSWGKDESTRISPVPDEPRPTAGLTAAEASKAANVRLFFGHQSVGRNVLGQIPAIFEAQRLRAPRMPVVPPGAASVADSPVEGGFWADAAIGRNKDPLGKIKAFDDQIRGGIGAQVDVALMKLCYADITDDSDVAGIFAQYRETLAALERDFPDVTFLHATVPLKTEPRDAKGLVKAVLGRRSGNAARERYNLLVRAEYPAGRLFDLAAIESTRPDGSRVRRGRAAGHFALFEGYAADPGHLNTVGARVAAGELVGLVARIANE
ncbi:MAG: glycosyltransferase [Brooklawnia sp.]|jgi:hypothetical protein